MTIAQTSVPTRGKREAVSGKREAIKMPSCDHVPKRYTGPSREDLIAMRLKYTNPAVFTLYGEPLLVVEGYMQWLFDETG